jgi:hypothetical protein
LAQFRLDFPTPMVPFVSLDELLPLAGRCMRNRACQLLQHDDDRAWVCGEKRLFDQIQQDMIALGVCDLASGISRGFVVSGADSRTAVADSSGGKTQLTVS